MHMLLRNKSGVFESNCVDLYDKITGELCDFASHAEENPIEATHQTRKKLKLLRAFAKLLQPSTNSDQYQFVNKTLRDWGRDFSELRDAHVRSIVLNEFSINPEFETDQILLNHLLEINHAEVALLESNTIIRRNRFSELEENIRNNRPIRMYFFGAAVPDLLLEGFNISYMKSHLAIKQANSDNDPDKVHEWRKRAKDVQYQAELLMSANENDNLTELHSSISLVCDDLGAANDFHMLFVWIKEIAKNEASMDFSELIEKVKTENKNFLSNSFSKGTDFYSKFSEPVRALTV